MSMMTEARRGAGARKPDEAHISAQQSPAFEEARIPQPDEHPSGSGGLEVPPRQGPLQALRLIGKISQKSHFERLFREGRTARAKGVWVSAIMDSSLDQAHVAYAIGRKFGGAVQRNHAKRRLRHIVRSSPSQPPPGWYLLGMNSSANALDFAALRATVEGLLAEVQR